MKDTFFPLLLLCILLWGCTINDKDFQIKGIQSNPTLVVPLATGNLSILDVLEQQDSSYIKIKGDGLIYFGYDTALISSDIRNLVTIPNLGNLTTSVSVPAGTYPANPNDYNSTSINQVVDLGITPEKLSEIAFKSGTLSYSLNLVPSNNNFLYAVVLAIPEFTSNTTGAGLSQEVSGNGSIQLSSYTFKSATANKFSLQLTLVVKKNAKSTVIPPGTNLNVTISFASMDFKYIKGFFGDQIAKPPAQTIEIGAFSPSLPKGASVSFAQPTLDFTVVSDYGVPLTVTFAKLEARKQGAALAMQTNPSSPIQITAPTSLGLSASTSVSVANVKQVVDFAPTQFYYQVSGHINTGLTTGNNFMADTSQLRVKLHAEVPLYGKASDIVMADTASLDLSDLDQSKIDSASLKASVTNELPLDANLQFILTDAKYVFIDSLLSSSQTGIIKGSSVDSNGELKAPGVFDQMIKLQSDKISKIFKARKIIIRAKLNTSKNVSGAAVDVKFKSQYKISVKLGLRAKLKVNATF